MAASFDPRTDDRPGSSRAPIRRRLIAPLAGSAILAMVAVPGFAGATAGPAIVAVAQPAALGADPVDTDGDQLSDALEAELGPERTVADADIDNGGSSDGDEVEVGSDPKDADSVPDGVPTTRPGGSARPSPKPSGQGGVTLPSTGTGPSATDGTGLIAMLAGGALAAVAGAFGLRRRRA